MNIVVINGSPKGKYSITLQYIEYLKKHFNNHNFEILYVGKYIRKFENKNELDKAIKLIEESDLVIFSYPVYSAVAPYQLHRFIELIKENTNFNYFKNKLATQITTSKHFYDFTAHRYIEENCYDLGFKTLKGLSADMDDLLNSNGRKQLKDFFDYVLYSVENDLFRKEETIKTVRSFVYSLSSDIQKNKNVDKFDTLILTNYKSDDINLQNMISEFQSQYKYKTRVINIRDFKFSGGCLGCLNCASDGKCIYKDNFETFLRDEIQTAGCIIYAATIKDHFIGTDFKLFNDRQFCEGHRTTTMGMPVGYILSGDYSKERNLINIIEGRCEVSNHFMLDVICDESLDNNIIASDIKKLASKTAYALENKITLPQNFLGVGGSKIFRDLIYITGGLMREDHKFYKKHGFYDFPQKQFLQRLKMKFVGYLLSLPPVKKQMRGKMDEILVAPYKKAVEND